MKNNNLFILMAAVFALISCGTANRTAYYSGSQLRNSIYYTPDNSSSQAYLQEQEYLQNLQEQTARNITASEQTVYSTSPTQKSIYVGEGNQVNIDAVPGVTYTIMDDQESYEARLRKFDSPYYSINIDINYPLYDYTWGWYNPWYRHYYGWHTPSWNMRWNWRYNWRWYEPWYSGAFWGMYDPFYDPWWGPSYWYGYWPSYWPAHHPVHKPGHINGHYPGAGPGARPHIGKDVYYGKRDSAPSYRNADKNRPSVPNGNATGKPGNGSVTRRPANVSQINSDSKAPAQKPAAPQNSSGQYRRVVKDNAAQNGHGVKTENTNKKGNTPARSGNSSYNRNSNNNNSASYTRSTGSQNRSSYSNSGNSSAGRSSGNTNYGNQGGSSYRRR